MNPKDILVGMYVQYSPSPGLWFGGVVDKEPWQLWCGTWVTKLKDMEPGYAVATHESGDKATTVFAASLARMRFPLEPSTYYRDHHVVDANKMV